MDNLAAAYNTLDTHKKNTAQSGVSGAEFIKLVMSLCGDFPQEHLEAILEVLGINDSDLISFEEFAAGVNTCLLFSEFLEEAENVFYECANESGLVQPQQYQAMLSSLRLTNPSMKMPTEEEIETATTYATGVSFKQFVSNLFTLATTET